MPPASKRGSQPPPPAVPGPSSDVSSKKRSGIAAETTSKKPKLDKTSPPKSSDPPPPNMNDYLPKTLIDRMQTAECLDEYNRYLRYLVAILFFNLRGIPENYFPAIISATVPFGLKSSSPDLLEALRNLNKDLTLELTTKLKSYADTLLSMFGEENARKAREVAQAHREAKTQIPRPFPGRESVKELMILSVKDIVEIWTPILSFVDDDYIDNPQALRGNWLHNLEESAYLVISRIASGLLITKRCYSQKAIMTDFASTSNRTPNQWPEFTLPFAWQNLPTTWGIISDTWPRPDKSIVNNKPENNTSIMLDSSSDDEELYASIDSTPDEDMRDVWMANDNFQKEHQHCFEQIIGIPGASITYQFDESYITQESSLIAQLNTSGIAMYAVSRLEARLENLKHYIFLAHKRLEEAEQALEHVNNLKKRNEIVQSKYRQLISQSIEVEQKVETLSVIVNRENRLHENAKNAVRSTGRLTGRDPRTTVPGADDKTSLSNMIRNRKGGGADHATTPASGFHNAYSPSTPTPITGRITKNPTGFLSSGSYRLPGASPPGKYGLKSTPDSSLEQGACDDPFDKIFSDTAEDHARVPETQEVHNVDSEDEADPADPSESMAPRHL